MASRITQLVIAFGVCVIVAVATPSAFASLIVSIPAQDQASLNTGGAGADQGLPQEKSEFSRLPENQSGLPGAGANCSSVTMTSAGHVALAIQHVLPRSALQTRLWGEAALAFPNPPPNSLLRPPRNQF